jgi:hypothetical protein
MGKLKNYVIDADEFAEQHFNATREEFVMMTKFYFDDRMLQERAIEYFDEIQCDLVTYYQESF